MNIAHSERPVLRPGSLIRYLSPLAPRLAERLALDAFTRPLRPAPGRGPVDVAPAPRPFRLEAGPSTLRAWEWGAGPTVLLVHGWNGHAAQMWAFVAPLVEAGYHVVAFDLPAHGQSSGTHATLLDLSRAVESVARRLGPVHGVVAHSLGATATALALTRGARIDRVVLLAPPVEVPFYVRAFADRLGLAPERADGMLARLRAALGADLDTLDLRRLAPRLRAPVAVIHDVEDREVPFAQGRALAAAWPGARLVPLYRAGHRRMLAKPDVIAEAVRFIDEQTPAAHERRCA